MPAKATRRAKTIPTAAPVLEAYVAAPSPEFTMMEILRAVSRLPAEERRAALVTALEVFDAAAAGDYGAGVLMGVAPTWKDASF